MSEWNVIIQGFAGHDGTARFNIEASNVRTGETESHTNQSWPMAWKLLVDRYGRRGDQSDTLNAALAEAGVRHG